MPDVLSYLCLILAHRINIVTTTLKLLITILELQVAELFIYHQADLSFQISDKRRYTHFWRYLKQHMDMVGTCFSFQNCYTFPFTQLSENFSNCTLLLPVKYLSTIFWGKYDMVFTVPSCEG